MLVQIENKEKNYTKFKLDEFYERGKFFSTISVDVEVDSGTCKGGNHDFVENQHQTLQIILE